MSIVGNINKVLGRRDEIEQKLSSGQIETDELTKLSRELAEIRPVAEQAVFLNELMDNLEQARLILEDEDADAELIEMATAEIEELSQKQEEAEHQLKLLLLPKDSDDARNAILEVRAGTGGDEAALFASDLFSMYQRFAAQNGWRFEVMEISETGIGGYKEATANISGQDVFARLKYESGVHRVQRVPETEAGGRIHTSAATVAVLPEAQDVDIDINESDLRVDVFRASGPGGQSVNTTDSAVRITHLPTGIWSASRMKNPSIKIGQRR